MCSSDLPETHLLIYLFIYLWLCWVFVSVPGLSLVAASGGHSSSRCAGLSLSRPLLLLSTGSRRAGSVVVAHGPSCSAACGIFPDQGSNPCPLQWQADSQPLCHQGSPRDPSRSSSHSAAPDMGQLEGRQSGVGQIFQSFQRTRKPRILGQISVFINVCTNFVLLLLLSSRWAQVQRSSQSCSPAQATSLQVSVTLS